jgi:outer membrane protein OmpA-like peptidoglycan-associated protein
MWTPASLDSGFIRRQGTGYHRGVMHTPHALLAAAALAAAAPASPAAPARPAPSEQRAVRCLLVAPLENASDLPEAAAAANQALVAFAGAERSRLLSEGELRAVFQGTALELADGVPPSLAVDLAEVLGADAVLYGSVEGRGRDERGSLAVSLRLAMAGTRDLLLVSTKPVVLEGGERPLVAVRRAATEAGRDAMALLGGPVPPKGCFDPEDLWRVRQAALRASASRPGPAPIRPAAADGSPAAKPTTPAPPPASARAAQWAWRLGARERFSVEGIAFEGRSPQLAREAGLEDLAGALRAAPAVRVRIEGFVDSSGRPEDDLKLSLRMAETAGERLVELGVARERLSWTGRGADAPLFPNFTARGRAGNRRVEVVPLQETASHP